VRALVWLGSQLAGGERGAPFDPVWLSVGDVDMTASSARAREVLGWHPRYPTAAAVMRHFDEVVPGRLDPRLRLFFGATRLAAKRRPPLPELAGMNEHIHVEITGRSGGNLGIHVEDSRIRVSAQPPRPPTSVVSLSDRLLLDLLAGRTDLGAAQLTGRIRIDGEPRAAMLLGGLIGSFRMARQQRGVPGLIGRGLAAWMRRSTPFGHGKEPAR
jgi:putative sterol carrier protein